MNKEALIGKPVGQSKPPVTVTPPKPTGIKPATLKPSSPTPLPAPPKPQHNLFGDLGAAAGHVSTLADPNVTWANPERLQAAQGLSELVNRHKDTGAVRALITPKIQSQLDMASGPLGQAARPIVEGLHSAISTPDRFGALLGNPAAAGLVSPLLRAGGAGGLAALWSYLSGNKNTMGHWNTLMRGAQPVKQAGSVTTVQTPIATAPHTAPNTKPVSFISRTNQSLMTTPSTDSSPTVVGLSRGTSQPAPQAQMPLPSVPVGSTPVARPWQDKAAAVRLLRHLRGLA